MVAIKVLDIKEPTVLINESNESLDLEVNADWYDLFVFHPSTRFDMAHCHTYGR